ncbi:MAG TPA: FGGY-family carbohydrate kinase, partial [Phototrophicaceae bacterium]|nr:FGGY-family carbohydrate kinase [Phototrophicaceae bacterium]
LRQTLDLSLELGKLQIASIITAGGAMESPVWRQIQTDIFGIPTQKSLLKEQTCIGAALLAGVRIGAYASLEEASAAVVQYDLAVEPDLARHSRYNELYAQFVELYPRLKGDFHQLTGFNEK